MEMDETSEEFLHTTSRAGLIGITAAAGALLGFVLQSFIAYYFGAGPNTDAFFMAQSTSELLSKLLLGGSIAAVFLPMFVERIAHQKKHEAWYLALNLLHLTFFILLAAVAFLALFASPFVRFVIAPGFDQETTALTVKLLYVLLPSFLCLFLVDLATAMLHSLRQFALPASLRLVAPLISIFSIILFVHALGIYSLALGVVIGSVVQLLILLGGLRRQGLRYRFILHPRDPAIRKLLRLVSPFIFSVLATVAAGIVYRIIVSHLAVGSLSTLKFAEKIIQFLTFVFLGSITTVIFPLLSEKASRKDFKGMRETIASAIRLMTFITVPMMVGLALLREPIIAFVYQRGVFTPENASMTAIALLFYGIGLTTNGISSVLGHAVLALQKTRAAAAVTILSQIIAIILFLVLTPTLAHAGLALASSLTPLAIALFYFLYLKRYLPNLRSIFWHRTFIKIGLSGAALAGTVLLIRQLTSERILFAELLIPVLAGAGVYFLVAYMLRVAEINDLIRLVRSKVLRYRV